MTNETPSRSDGGEYPQQQFEDRLSEDEVAAASDSSEPAGTIHDQTPEEQAITSFMGVIQTEMQRQGWTFDVVSVGDPTILGATSPQGIDYSMTMGKTP